MTRATRVFLGFSLLVWFPYGIYCAIVPSFLAGAAGVVGATPTGLTEIRAMYGGAQAGIGALCGMALLRPTLVRPAILMSAFVTAGLGSMRTMGVLVDGGLSGYTIGALIFEYFAFGFAMTVLRRNPA